MKKILSLVMCIVMALSFMQMTAVADGPVELPDDSFTGGNVHKHDYKYLKSDADGHWYECKCGRKENDHITTHIYTRKHDDNEHYLYCTVCGYISEKQEHLLNIPSAEQEGHTLACECGYVTEVSAHNYSNDCDKTCNTCNFVRSVKAHRYTNSCDAYCNECKAKRSITHKYTTKTVKATTSKSGYKIDVCSVCKREKSGSKTYIYYPKTVKLSYSTCTYSGKTKYPTVIVKDSKGKTISSKYYTVTTPKTRKYVGKYKYTIKFKGNYSGTKYLYLTINPKSASINNLTAKKKALTVKLNRNLTQSTGYQIQYSTSKSFKSYKTKTVTSYKTSTVNLTSLKAKTTYYVRVRTYKTVSGKKYYSNWSSYKYKKTK